MLGGGPVTLQGTPTPGQKSVAPTWACVSGGLLPPRVPPSQGGGAHLRGVPKCAARTDILPQGPTALHIFLSIKITEKEKRKCLEGCRAVQRSSPSSERPDKLKPPGLVCPSPFQ